MKQLEEMETSLHKYEVRTDLNKLRELLHPDFIEIGYSGSTHDYASIVSRLPTETRPDHTIWSQGFECFDLAPSVKLLLYKSAHLYPGGNLKRHSKRSSVWVNESGLWQIKYHQATLVSEFDFVNS